MSSPRTDSRWSNRYFTTSVSGKVCVTFADVAVRVKLYVPGGVGTPRPPPPPPFDPPPPQAIIAARTPAAKISNSRDFRLLLRGRIHIRAATPAVAQGHTGMWC